MVADSLLRVVLLAGAVAGDGGSGRCRPRRPDAKRGNGRVLEGAGEQVESSGSNGRRCG